MKVAMKLPRPAMVVAVIALIIAIAGTVRATLSGNSAGTRQQNTKSTHSATCTTGTTLIRSLCFDSSPSGPVTGVKAAADRCAKAGGWLPSADELIAARSVLNLGDGSGSHSVFTDSYDYNASAGEARTTVVNANEQKSVVNENTETHQILATYEYICVYPLVR